MDANMEDLRTRLEGARDGLRVAQRRATTRDEAVRLGGKVEGVSLAIDYLRAYT